MKKLIFFCIILSSTSVFSESVGKVLFTSGDVSGKVGGSETKLSRGSDIFVGETIITGAAGKANIKYSNGTTVGIDPGSNYQIQSFTPKADVTLKTALNSGSIEQDSHNKGAQKKSTVTTPVVALAILGTKTRITATSEHTYVKVTQGTVCAMSTDTSTPAKKVTAGDVCIGPNQQFSSGTFDVNKKFSPGENASLTVSGGSVVDITQTVTVDTTVSTINSTVPGVIPITELADISVIGVIPP